jgi:hypothetical protein
MFWNIPIYSIHIARSKAFTAVKLQVIVFCVMKHGNLKCTELILKIAFLSHFVSVIN